MMAKTSIILSNGLKLTYNYIQGQSDIFLDFQFGVGHENDGHLIGLSHLTEHMVFGSQRNTFKGYGLYDASTNNFFTNYYFNCNHDNYIDSIKGFFENVQDTSFDKNNFITERDYIIRDEYNLRLDDKLIFIYDALPLLYGQSNYTLAARDTLSKITLNDIENHIETYYTPNNCEVIISGDLAINDNWFWKIFLTEDYRHQQLDNLGKYINKATEGWEAHEIPATPTLTYQPGIYINHQHTNTTYCNLLFNIGLYEDYQIVISQYIINLSQEECYNITRKVNRLTYGSDISLISSPDNFELFINFSATTNHTTVKQLFQSFIDAINSIQSKITDEFIIERKAVLRSMNWTANQRDMIDTITAQDIKIWIENTCTADNASIIINGEVSQKDFSSNYIHDLLSDYQSILLTTEI